MRTKSIPISLRLSQDEYSLLEFNASHAGMTNSQYIRSLISGSVPSSKNILPEVASVLCRVYILLEEKGLETEKVSREVQKLCQL